MLMGEKHLKIMILLFAEAADVDIWADLHHRVTCNNFRRHKKTNEFIRNFCEIHFFTLRGMLEI